MEHKDEIQQHAAQAAPKDDKADARDERAVAAAEANYLLSVRAR